MPKKKKTEVISNENSGVPLGKPLDLTDEDLDKLSEVTAEDIERIKGITKKRTPKLAALLDSKAKENK